MEAYAVERLLGRGGMGEVYLVTRKTDDEPLALKRANFASLPADEQKQTVVEATLLSRLRHPNIITYHDHFFDGGDFCIVMELAPSDLLKEARKARKAGTPISEHRLVSILAQVGSALHYAHSCRVLHRDVKPENVLLTADGTPKLADFGISCTLAVHGLQMGRELKRLDNVRLEGDNEMAEELRGDLRGSAPYMAPELFNSALHVDGDMYSPASDVWALGVMMYFLMLMRLPYDGESTMSLWYKLVTDELQNAMRDAKHDLASNAGNYSAALCACVEGMLVKRAKLRMTLPGLLSCELLQRHLRGYEHPPFVDLLEERAQLMGGRLPDCYAFGHGAAYPRPREDLVGLAIMHVACGAAHCAVVAQSGELFTWGENACGQLGHANRLALKKRRRVVLSPPETRIVGVACGRAHTLALASHGEVFACGSDKYGQLGLGAAAFCAADVGAALMILDGEVRVGGVGRSVRWLSPAPPSDVNGATILHVDEALGGAIVLDSGVDEIRNPELTQLRDHMGCVLAPTAIRTTPPAGDRWAVLACGEQHSAALTSGGDAYTWGNAEDGRLGLGLDGSGGGSLGAIVAAPRRVEVNLACPEAAAADRRAAMVDCGDNFTAFVGEDGRAWGCGANWDAQLGLDPVKHEICSLPARLLASNDWGIDCLSCGSNHIAAVDGLGRLWVWGGPFGETPMRQEIPKRDQASALEHNDRDSREVALVACGSGMVFAVTDAGDAFTWGDGPNGCLGVGDGDNSHTEPQPIEILSTPSARVQMAACARSTSSQEQGSGVLVLAVPEAAEQLSEQFRRFLLQDAPQVW